MNLQCFRNKITREFLWNLHKSVFPNNEIWNTNTKKLLETLGTLCNIFRPRSVPFITGTFGHFTSLFEGELEEGRSHSLPPLKDSCISKTPWEWEQLEWHSSSPHWFVSTLRIYFPFLSVSLSLFNLYSTPISFLIPLSTPFILSLYSYIFSFSFRQTCIRIMMQGKMSVSFKYPFWYFSLLLATCFPFFFSISITKGNFPTLCYLLLSLSPLFLRLYLFLSNVQTQISSVKRKRSSYFYIYFKFVKLTKEEKKTWLNTKRINTK